MSLIKEIWKDIIGYEGLYQVSNIGNVKSFKISKNGILFKPKSDKDGYLEVGIRDKLGKRKYYRVHRLVAIAFIPNPNNLPEVNHKDNIAYHNNVENLEWCTVQYNNQYRFKSGYEVPFGENSSHTNLTNEQVVKIFILGHSGKYTEPELARMFHTTRGVINGIRLRKSWQKITKDIGV